MIYQILGVCQIFFHLFFFEAVIRNSGLPAFAQQLEESAILAPVSVMESCTEATLMGEKNS